MKITKSSDGISLQMLIKNARDEGGSFCVNKNTTLIAGGLHYKLQSFENIPECPEVHEFEFIGDNLIFHLHFPPIPSGINIIEISENCNDNCFYFKGLIIDQKMNDELNSAFEYYESGMLLEGLAEYKDLLIKYEEKEPALEALSYFYIVKILEEIGNDQESFKWFESFLEKDIPDSEWVIEKLSK